MSEWQPIESASPRSSGFCVYAEALSMALGLAAAGSRAASAVV